MKYRITRITAVTRSAKACSSYLKNGFTLASAAYFVGGSSAMYTLIK